MMRYFPLVILVLFLSSCEDVKPCVIRPLTEKEENFIATIEKNGLEVSVIRFDYWPPLDQEVRESCLSDGIYHFRISNDTYKAPSQLDSMRNEARRIAVELYTKVIEDSILHFSDGINVVFEGESLLDGRRYGYLYQSDFKKEDLESYCGFRIKKKKKGYFIHEQVPQKSDTLKLEEESYSD
jgi:hypothetical protein